MRQSSFAEAGFERYSKRTRRERFLQEMDRVVPWEALEALIEPCYPSKRRGAGRPAVGLDRMLRIHFLQHWFNLSDPAVEEALYDSKAMRRFVGIDLGREPAPDERIISSNNCSPNRILLSQRAGWSGRLGFHHNSIRSATKPAMLASPSRPSRAILALSEGEVLTVCGLFGRKLLDQEGFEDGEGDASQNNSDHPLQQLDIALDGRFQFFNVSPDGPDLDLEISLGGDSVLKGSGHGVNDGFGLLGFNAGGFEGVAGFQGVENGGGHDVLQFLG